MWTGTATMHGLLASLPHRSSTHALGTRGVTLQLAWGGVMQAGL